MQGSTVQVTNGTIAINAESKPSIETIAVNVAVAAGIGASAVVVDSVETINSTVNAFVESSSLTATGKITVAAETVADANPDVVAVSGGVVSVNVVNYTATIAGSTNAYVTGSR